jgi:hypothetical protein
MKLLLPLILKAEEEDIPLKNIGGPLKKMGGL